jgi:hypothetical protein
LECSIKSFCLTGSVQLTHSFITYGQYIGIIRPQDMTMNGVGVPQADCLRQLRVHRHEQWRSQRRGQSLYAPKAKRALGERLRDMSMDKVGIQALVASLIAIAAVLHATHGDIGMRWRHVIYADGPGFQPLRH